MFLLIFPVAGVFLFKMRQKSVPQGPFRALLDKAVNRRSKADMESYKVSIQFYIDRHLISTDYRKKKSVKSEF